MSNWVMFYEVLNDCNLVDLKRIRTSRKTMNRKQVLSKLTRIKPELMRRLGVTRLALFGSTARNEAPG